MAKGITNYEISGQSSSTFDVTVTTAIRGAKLYPDVFAQDILKALRPSTNVIIAMDAGIGGFDSASGTYRTYQNYAVLSASTGKIILSGTRETLPPV